MNQSPDDRFSPPRLSGARGFVPSSRRIRNSISAKAELWFWTVERLRTTGRCSRTTDASMREIARSRALDRELAAELWPQSAQNPVKRPEIHNTDAENLDGSILESSNHPEMEGFYPVLPLNPHHPRADGDAVAAGF
jgi:hypothetical protein